jgi:hypothetical protein
MATTTGRSTEPACSDQVKEDDMGRACSTKGGEEKRIYVIGGKARKKETTRKTKMQVGK